MRHLFTLMGAVLSILVFLSTRFSEEYPWTSRAVYVPLILSGLFIVSFVIIELLVAPEPVLAPFLLKQKIPVLVGISNCLVATCNFTVMYNFPTWFQTVLLTSASEAGARLIPNGIFISYGSLFAGWMTHKTGKYKRLNLIFGLFPFVAAILLSMMREDSRPIVLWLNTLPSGFGNTVVLQTMLIALLAHLPNSAIAVGTGFGQLFRGIGQVGGVAVSAAIFQSVLNVELHKRIHTDNANEVLKLFHIVGQSLNALVQLITRIRHSTSLVATLPLELQRAARDSYAVALRTVFILAACSTFLAYLARLPIPDKSLDSIRSHGQSVNGEPTQVPTAHENPLEVSEEPEGDPDDFDADDRDVVPHIRSPPRRRRLSAYDSSDGGMDLENDDHGGSARPRIAYGSV
ncbi:hypothetical protein EW026_g7218 [Hermanssonia centrifuga]|uniref:Uncharacterized protein n=1 Tax=Hermanssonia centrifuga TaxID=98765 RepID=A0A4S4K8I4_9APHY|nr:hypothetical protein EW026_g7218 [Hermanssonia centrifuga]